MLAGQCGLQGVLLGHRETAFFLAGTVKVAASWLSEAASIASSRAASPDTFAAAVA